ncbi:MAG: phosphoribosylaminoimidazolecarboxamide formyltransferase [Peptococcaceae bacterium]|nr:phosphoribosylaminoimidazolecarboxamide formyltransferase [Peptococcaceae bacterium]
MRELTLKYGCNPYQKPARISVGDGKGELPIQVLNGSPGYINLLDGLNGWQLVRELWQAAGLPAAASFKHVSPAGAAVGLPLTGDYRRACGLGEADGMGLADETGEAGAGQLSPLACAYVRARGADRLSSFGDFIALSHTCDVSTASYIAHEVSDGIIAPDYEPAALAILKKKRGGNYTILRLEPDYEPAAIESKTVFGLVFEQGRNDLRLDEAVLSHIPTQKKELPPAARRDLLIALITLKYTQSNSVCYAKDGQAIGIGAGQQSRIHCTRLAGNKADIWYLRQHPQVLDLPFLPGLGRPARDNAIDLYLSEEEAPSLLAAERWRETFSRRPPELSQEEKRRWLAGLRDVALASDGFFPFPDNIQRAARSGAAYIAQPGGSIRDEQVIAACDRLNIAMAFTGVRLFHH